MRRTNIYLTDDELTALQLVGKRQGKAVAELVREAVDAWLEARGVRHVEPDEWADRFGQLLDRRRRVADGTGWSEADVEGDVLAAVTALRSRATPGRD